MGWRVGSAAGFKKAAVVCRYKVEGLATILVELPLKARLNQENLKMNHLYCF